MTALRKSARISRTGIMDYLAGELPGVPAGTPPNAIVKVYRDPAEVFDAESLKSFENLPVTLGHPPGGVTEDNFRKVVHGFTLSPVTRDGTHARVDLDLHSRESQDAYQKGMRQLSAGYRMNLVWKSGVTADGMPYDAQQQKIRGNHLAFLKAGRAHTAQILDTESKKMDEKLFEAALTELRQGLADAKADVARITAERDTLAGQVESLKAAQVTDEQIAEKVAVGVADALKARDIRAAVIEKAKKCAPKLDVTDAMPLVEIQKAAIQAKQPGVVFDGKSPEHIGGMFDGLQVADEAPTKHKTIPATGRNLNYAQVREMYGR